MYSAPHGLRRHAVVGFRLREKMQLIALESIGAALAGRQPICAGASAFAFCLQHCRDRLIAETWPNLMALVGSHEPNTPLA
jgi:hypothetical protein